MKNIIHVWEQCAQMCNLRDCCQEKCLKLVQHKHMTQPASRWRDVCGEAWPNGVTVQRPHLVPEHSPLNHPENGQKHVHPPWRPIRTSHVGHGAFRQCAAKNHPANPPRPSYCYVPLIQPCIFFNTLYYYVLLNYRRIGAGCCRDRRNMLIPNLLVSCSPVVIECFINKFRHL